MRFVLTGATHGLGRIVALDLAARGVELVVLARDPRKVDELRREAGGAAFITAVEVDLASLRQVRRVGEEIARSGPLDGLINSAGAHVVSPRLTTEGFSEMVAVNYLAPWVLTAALLPSLTASPSARIVSVGSRGADMVKEIDPRRDIADTSSYSRTGSFVRYGRTKLMDIMFSQELARRLSGTGVTSNCCDPGFNATGLSREWPLFSTVTKALGVLGAGRPERGAGIIASLAIDQTYRGVTGQYVSRSGKPVQCPEAGRSADVQRELWIATESLLGKTSLHSA
ncbi:SDR family NAD(P)-dependent oxidoreductase [Lentzea sp. NPDC059081]|uniref:SDR family NAD(P)-dependent oxidoreductase n=1 Tax=Lentzea sp. NPDC059081 TaxID=3346719 RepID=UPI003693F34B